MEKFNDGKISVYDLMLYIKEHYRTSTSTPIFNLNFIGDLNKSDIKSILDCLGIEKNDKEARKAIGLCRTEHIVEMLPNTNKKKEGEEEEEGKYCRNCLFNDDNTLKCDIFDDNNKEIICSLLFIKDGIFLKDFKTKKIVSKINYDLGILRFMINAILNKDDVFFKKNSRYISIASIIFMYTNEDLLLDEIEKIYNSENVDEKAKENVLSIIKTVSEAGQLKTFKFLLLNGYFPEKDTKEIVDSVLLSKNIEIIRIAEQRWFGYLEPKDFLSVFYRTDDDVVRFLFDSFPGFREFLKNNMNETIGLFTKINSPVITTFLLNEFAIDLESKEGFFAFLNAIKGGQYDVFKFLINEYKTITTENTTCNSGITPLSRAINFGLYCAIDSEQFEIVNYLLSKFEVNLNIRYGEMAETVFHCATRRKNKEIINLLLSKNKEIPENKNKINFYTLDKSGCSALNNLILDKNPLFYSLIKEYKINLAVLEKISSLTPFYCFVKSGNIEMVNQYLKKDININRQYGDKLETAIYIAIMSNNTEMVKLLLDCPGIDLNIPSRDDDDEDGFYIPITVSVEEIDVKVEILQLLLSYKKLDVNATDSFQSTALHWAVIQDSADKAKALLSRKDLDLNAIDIDGSTALSYTYEDYLKIKILNMLLKDERLETTTEELNLIEEIVIENLESLEDGIFEFFKSAEEIKCKITKNNIKSIDNNFIISRIKELLELKNKGANEEEEEEEEWIDKNKNKNHDITILSIAINEGNKEIFDILISSEEDINSLNLYRMSPLSIAIGNNNIEFIQALLSRKDLNINIIDLKGLKPINYAVMLAKKTGNFDILKILVNDSRFEISDEEIEMFGQEEEDLDNFSKKPYPKTINIKIVNILREAKGRNDYIRNQKHLVKDMSDMSKKIGNDDKYHNGKPL